MQKLIRCDRSHQQSPGIGFGYERRSENRRRPTWCRLRSAHRRARQTDAGARPETGQSDGGSALRPDRRVPRRQRRHESASRRKLCGECDVHLRLACRGRGRRRVARRAHRHRARPVRCAAAGGDDRLPHRIPIHVGGDHCRGAGRGNSHRLHIGRHRTGFPRARHLHAGDERCLSPTIDSADPRAGRGAFGVGGSAVVPPDHR